MSEDAEPVYAFYMATIRVEVDPRSEEVTEVLVDEGTMEQPAMIARADGSSLTGLDRNRRFAFQRGVMSGSRSQLGLPA